jgi:hypothetical protein
LLGGKRFGINFDMDLYPGFARLRQVGAQQVAQRERDEKTAKDAERAKALAEKAQDEQFDERWS